MLLVYLGEWTSWHDDGLVDKCALFLLHGGSARAKKQKSRSTRVRGRLGLVGLQPVTAPSPALAVLSFVGAAILPSWSAGALMASPGPGVGGGSLNGLRPHALLAWRVRMEG